MGEEHKELGDVRKTGAHDLVNLFGRDEKKHKKLMIKTKVFKAKEALTCLISKETSNQ